MGKISPPAVWAALTMAIIMPDLTPCFGAVLVVFATGTELLRKFCH